MGRRTIFVGWIRIKKEEDDFVVAPSRWMGAVKVTVDDRSC